MKTILVPTDFSPNANKALNYAAEIALRSKATIIIVHVTDLTHASMNENVILPVSIDKDIIHEANRQLNVLATVTKEITGAAVDYQLYNGFVPDAIQLAAKENNADLIIMGTLGDAGIRENLFGSITAKVISHVGIPVLAVPLMYEWTPAKSILLAINNFEDPAQVLEPLHWLASIFKATVQMSIFIDEAAAENAVRQKKEMELFYESLQKEYPDIDIHPATIYGHNFEDAIKAHITENQSDILVMITHKRNFLVSIFNRSMTKKMSYHTDIPLLSIPVH
jgi:nucleotide-binding universal stress UspA family protein